MSEDEAGRRVMVMCQRTVCEKASTLYHINRASIKQGCLSRMVFAVMSIEMVAGGTVISQEMFSVLDVRGMLGD